MQASPSQQGNNPVRREVKGRCYFRTESGRHRSPEAVPVQVVIMDEDLRKLRQDVAVDLSPSSPAVIQAATEYESPAKQEEWHGDQYPGALNVAAAGASSEFHDWEVLSGHSGPNSPRSSMKGHFKDSPKMEWPAATEGKDLQGQDDLIDEESRLLDACDANEEPEEEASIEAEEADADVDSGDPQDMPVEAKEEASPPDSPHLRSGTSSFSHISSPASYHFGNSDDEGSDTDSSQWTSDGEEVASKRQGSQATRSEADSDEAIQDVVAVSQEGSLGSLSDSDAGYRRMSRTTCARSTPGIGGSRLEGGSGSFSFPEVATLALDLASLDCVSPQSPRSASSLPRRRSSPAPADVSPGGAEGASDEAKAAADAALKAAQDITAAVAAEFGEDRGEIVEDATDADTTHPKEDAVFVEAKKPKRHDVMGALRVGMDKLAAATQNTLQAVGSTDIAQRFWVCLQEWASALMACLPAAERARARLQVELARMRSRARSVGWSQIALAASLGIMAVIAGCALVKNAALHRALRRKDNEMNQLILMVFNLQESLQGAARSSRVPIVRHACAMSSFPPLGHIQPANIVSFEALSATKAIYC
ncbi:hypothetical protein WJX75_000177 [Coccomyxa subellipsoidea]|uniref:Uncharacterized protein n=1 Tax=Coccomyxa subellipsoidea TaxID=248742 RepID=A0ABR2YNZ6_9CHLO